MRLFAALLLTAASIAAQVHYPGGNGNATQIQGRAVDSSAPSDKNVMCWTQSATHWGPCAIQTTAPGGTNTAIQFNHPNGTFAGNAAIAAEQPTSLGTPAAPTVTPTCSGTCATTWGYQLYAVNAVGASIGSSETTALNAATLDSTHKNTITAVAIPGATAIMVYRSTVGVSPSTIAIIGSIAATGGNLVDTGLTGDLNSSPPNADGTQGVFFSQNATFGYPFVNMLPPTTGVLLNNTPLSLYQSGGATSLQFYADNATYPSTGPVLPSTDTDHLGQISFAGYSGGYYGAADIVANVEGTPTQSTVPGQLLFRTFDANGVHVTTQHSDGTLAVNNVFPTGWASDFPMPQFTVGSDTKSNLLGLQAPTPGPQTFCGAYRGTAASHTATQDGDVLCSYSFTGYDGTDFESAAVISVNQSGAASAGNYVPASMTFKIVNTSGSLFNGISIDGNPTNFGNATTINGAIINSLAVTFGNWPTTVDGTSVYCSDCKPTSSIDDTAASGGSGCLVVRENGAWRAR